MTTSPDRPAPEGPGAAAVAVLLASMIVGAGLGIFVHGMLGGLLGVLIGSSFGLLSYVWKRARAMRGGLTDARVPDLRGLPPEQAITVLSAMIGHTRDGAPLGSAVLAGIAAARDRAEQDLPAAIAALDELARAHPRSPAIASELALLHRRAGDEAASIRATSMAITLAIDGGMNATAVRAFAAMGEISESHRHLELKDETRARLAKALAAHGNHAGARWCLDQGG